MRTIGRIGILLVGLFFLTSCSYKLYPPQLQMNKPINDFVYFYVTPAAEIQSTSGTYIYNGTGGSSHSTTTSPVESISGYLTKMGRVRVPEIKDELRDRTMIINFSISGRRSVSFGYAQEVTIQMLSAKTMEVLCVCSAEGIGSTEADDIRIAIQRCLDTIYKQ